jgi:hypothetical protein
MGMMSKMSSEWKQRLDILRRRARKRVLDPLYTHGWKAAIEKEMETGEYVLIAAERGGQRHVVALMYTSATDNAVYKSLVGQVEYIFFNGAPYMLEAFAQGVTTPIGPADDFHDVLLKWNETSSDGKFVPAAGGTGSIVAYPPKYRMLLSEEPIQAIWLRLRQLQSVTLAKKLIRERARRENIQLDEDVVRSKAEGVAYVLRNASDYFHAGDPRNVSQRIVNLYYGSLSFAFAEMLASTRGSNTLVEIEESTKQGHGLYTVDGLGDGLEQLVVFVVSSGFFPAWMKSLGLDVDTVPRGKRKPSKYKDLEGSAATSWLTLAKLFARIPEVSDLFNDIFEEKPGWVAPFIDQHANPRRSRFDQKEKASRTYVRLLDSSARLTKEDIATFPGPISEIGEVEPDGAGRHFRVAVDHVGKERWQDSLQVHHSPFERQALILPIFGVVAEYRAICVVLLYALSIVVRYRPSVWRRVQEGDLDHMRVLIEAFLAVVERVLPEQFLEKVTGQPVVAKQPGPF